ncbi:peptidylprolyl isomerase [Sphingobium sp. H33]|uniref:peptidylprolyl isomerase n=2 Tax=Sphingobium nicotianae TaxID=2782607 RepID=A0A9X1DER4_9SPHN|nr:peptidylprolyl isomerase [Sphingobium nicotianae]
MTGTQTAPAAAARPTEEEIQARIEADLAAQAKAEAQARAEAAKRQADADAAEEARIAREAQAAQASAPTYRTVPVILTTSLGTITIALEVERAPITSAYFLRYVDEKRFDGTSFYRSFKYPDGTPGGFIQGGTQNDPKRILKPVPHEPTSKTGLSHVNGAVSIAQAAPGTGTGDFFIMVGSIKGFDADATQPGFAVFGRVVEGMDVVRAIADAPRSATAGEGVMRGQMLDPTVKILTARRAPGS